MVRGKNAHAWVELWMDRQGWVRFDPTPRGDEVNPSTNSTIGGVGFDPRQFIPVPEEGADSIVDPLGGSPGAPTGRSFEEGEPLPPIPGPILEFAGFRLSLFQLAVIGALLLVASVPLVKWIRRRRRLARLEHGDITGAWEEIVDRLTDLGRPPSPHQTPGEVAVSVDGSMKPLARTVGEALYGPTAVLPAAKLERAAESFAETEVYLRRIYRPFDRFVSWLRPRSLLWWRRE